MEPFKQSANLMMRVKSKVCLQHNQYLVRGINEEDNASPSLHCQVNFDRDGENKMASEGSKAYGYIPIFRDSMGLCLVLGHSNPIKVCTRLRHMRISRSKRLQTACIAPMRKISVVMIVYAFTIQAKRSRI